MANRDEVVKKFSPSRLKTSGKMTAILGFLLERQWTDPHFVEMVITSDRFVLAAHDGDCGANEFIGDVDALNRNLRDVVDAVGLDENERIIFAQIAGGRVQDHSGSFNVAEVISA